MKKLLFSALCICAFAITSQAQSYKSFEWDIIKLGYVLPAGDGVTGGISLASEPRYNVNDQFSVGLKWEAALFGSDIEGASISGSGSLALMGDYYISNNENNRFFAGLGIGTFSSGTVEVNGMAVGGEAGSNLGIIPRIGYELGHLRIAAEYNLPFGEGTKGYLGINLAATLFGGYKG